MVLANELFVLQNNFASSPLLKKLLKGCGEIMVSFDVIMLNIWSVSVLAFYLVSSIFAKTKNIFVSVNVFSFYVFFYENCGKG